jgi:hypothetical protein
MARVSFGKGSCRALIAWEVGVTLIPHYAWDGAPFGLISLRRNPKETDAS